MSGNELWERDLKCLEGVQAPGLSVIRLKM